MATWVVLSRESDSEFKDFIIRQEWSSYGQGLMMTLYETLVGCLLELISDAHWVGFWLVLGRFFERSVIVHESVRFL